MLTQFGHIINVHEHTRLLIVKIVKIVKIVNC